MLEIGCVYSKPEMTRMLGTKANGNIRKKLERYGVDFTMEGEGEKATYTIHGMSFPFKVFAIVELGFDANTDCIKLRNFLYHFFEDEVFMAMPDEVKETWMEKMGQHLTRQTIATYTRRLETNNLRLRHNVGSKCYKPTHYE